MFCSNPFTHILIRPDGNVYSCLCSWPSIPIGNILTASLKNIWTGTAAEEMRRSIIDGSFRYCSACPFLPGPKGFVTEQAQNFPSVERIALLKLDYDYSCNLTCPSCRKTSSNKWINKEKTNQIHAEIMSPETLGLADYIYVSGAGEPLASALYLDLLQNLPFLTPGNKPQIILHTNGLLLNSSTWEKLDNTQKRVTGINISVDAACAKTYELNRGGSWTKLLKNLNFVKSLRQSSNHLKFTLFFTVQTNNFKEIADFVALANTLIADEIDFIGLGNWGTYTNEEYVKRAIHLPSHPLHGQLLKILECVQSVDTRHVVKSFDSLLISARSGRPIHQD